MKAIENIQKRPICNVLGEPIADRSGQPRMMSMVTYIAQLVSDATFSKGSKYEEAVRRAVRMGEALKLASSKEPNAWNRNPILIRDDDHERLVAVIDEPSGHIDVLGLASHLEFIEAIRSARSVGDERSAEAAE